MGERREKRASEGGRREKGEKKELARVGEGREKRASEGGEKEKLVYEGREKRVCKLIEQEKKRITWMRRQKEINAKRRLKSKKFLKI